MADADKAMQTTKTKDNADRYGPAEAHKDWQHHGPLKSSWNDCNPPRTASLRAKDKYAADHCQRRILSYPDEFEHHIRFLTATYLVKKKATDEQCLKVERDQILCQRCEVDVSRAEAIGKRNKCKCENLREIEIRGDHKNIFFEIRLETIAQGLDCLQGLNSRSLFISERRHQTENINVSLYISTVDFYKTS